MNKQDQPLFEPTDIGLGFHNVGSGVLRFATDAVVKKIDHHYGQRCGHIPTNAKTIGVFVENASEDTTSQMAYLSELMGKQLTIMSSAEVKKATTAGQKTIIVPYANVPESETFINELGASSWGLPGKMTHVLKNKTEFYRLIDELAVDGFQSPEYIIAELENVVTKSKQFLKHIEGLYDQAGVKNHYPLGVMLRASDEDGNYGCALVHEKDGQIIVIPDGETAHARFYTDWDEAFHFSQTVLSAAMNPEKENRVVVSRYIEIIDSPGISLVMLDGEVFSLGWNGQLQKPGSKACVGTSSYHPKTDYLKRLQTEHEAYIADLFETFLRKTAKNCSIDFSTIRGMANTDIMIPSEIEKVFQKKTGKENLFYFAECNPRFTNYTDAILAMVSISRNEQNVASMKAVITQGIATYDKYKLPEGLDPKTVREEIFIKDQQLQTEGTRIICRMATSPMGLILTGDIALAERTVENIVKQIEDNK